MAKAATESEVVNNGTAMVGVSEVDDILAEYGITTAEVYVPDAPTITKSNFDELCTLHTEIKDGKGNTVKDVIGHSGPLLFLELNGEKDGDKFAESGYDGFYIFTIWNKEKGKVIITLGRPTGEKTPPLVNFLKTLKPGAVFQVASVKTNSGYHTFNPVPVQK